MLISDILPAMGAPGDKPEPADKADTAEKSESGEKPLERGSHVHPGAPVLRGTNKVVGAITHPTIARGTVKHPFPSVAKDTRDLEPAPVVEIDLAEDTPAPARGTRPLDVDPGALPSTPTAMGSDPWFRTVAGSSRLAADSIPPAADPTLPIVPNDWLLMLLETDAIASRTATEEALRALLHARKVWEESSKNKDEHQELVDDFREKEVFARAALLSEAHAWRRLAVAAHGFASQSPGLDSRFATVADRASRHEAIASRRLTRGFKPLSSRASIDLFIPEQKSYEETHLAVATSGPAKFTGPEGGIETTEPDPEMVAASIDDRAFRNQPLILSVVVLLLLVLAASVYLLPPNDTSGAEIAVRALTAAMPFVIVGGILAVVGALLGRKEPSSW
jgi:hypothetical protein